MSFTLGAPLPLCRSGGAEGLELHGGTLAVVFAKHELILYQFFTEGEQMVCSSRVLPKRNKMNACRRLPLRCEAARDEMVVYNTNYMPHGVLVCGGVSLVGVIVGCLTCLHRWGPHMLTR